jgi:flavorubredoxin
MTICAEPLGLKYKPGAEELQKCAEVGRDIARQLKAK